jgi:hypothetical protein
VLGNNATPASITQINISETDANAASMASVLDRWGASTTAADKGVIRIVDVTDRAKFIELKLTAAPTDAGTYRTCPVAYLASGGAIANTATVSVEFERSGDKGADGAGAGDVVGPASATNNSLARFDGTTGKLLKDGAVIGADVQAYLPPASQAEMEAGTEAALRSMSPLRVAQAIAAKSQSVAWQRVSTTSTLSAAPARWLANTSAAAIDLTLNPALPDLSEIIIKDSKGTFATNRCRMYPGTGRTIMGATFLDLTINYAEHRLVLDGTDWRI